MESGGIGAGKGLIMSGPKLMNRAWVSYYGCICL